MEFACDNIDQLVTISIRPPGKTRGVSRPLYLAARGSRPISFEIAEALWTRKGSRVGIFTGATEPEHLPRGENDGPLGAVVLGRALVRLGYPTTIYVEAEPLAATRELATLTTAGLPIEELERAPGMQHTRLAGDLDVAITVEKAGVNERGVQHSANGYSRQGTRAVMDGIITSMNQAGKLTIGIGDWGTEIGFGAIFEQARSILPYGMKCQCPCGGGNVSVTPTRLLYPVAVSNWGAYGVAAALAIRSGERECAHESSVEERMIRLGMEMDLRDGGTGTAAFAVDGVPGAAAAGVVAILRALVEVTLTPFSRGF